MSEFEIKVRFAETDAAGHVNNASYFIYFEEARMRFFEDNGFYKINNESHTSFILASTKCDYISQAYARERLKIITKVEAVGNKSFTFSHEIKNAETGKLVALGTATVVTFDYKKQQSIPIPLQIREKLQNKLMEDSADSLVK